MGTLHTVGQDAGTMGCGYFCGLAISIVANYQELWNTASQEAVYKARNVYLKKKFPGGDYPAGSIKTNEHYLRQGQAPDFLKTLGIQGYELNWAASKNTKDAKHWLDAITEATSQGHGCMMADDATQHWTAVFPLINAHCLEPNERKEHEELLAIEDDADSSLSEAQLARFNELEDKLNGSLAEGNWHHYEPAGLLRKYDSNFYVGSRQSIAEYFTGNKIYMVSKKLK